MTRRTLAGLDRKRLRLGLVFFFLALAVPSGFLVHQAYGQLKWEVFHQYRTLAEELSTRIDDRLGRLIAEEEGRSLADYGFLVVAGDPSAGYLKPSPLSVFPVKSDFPGLLGHFQVDAEGVFSTPLVPAADALAASYGISEPELAARRALEDRIRAILSRNRLVEPQVAAGRKAEETGASGEGGRAAAGSRASRAGDGAADPDPSSPAGDAGDLARGPMQERAAHAPSAEVRSSRPASDQAAGRETDQAAGPAEGRATVAAEAERSVGDRIGGASMPAPPAPVSAPVSAPAPAQMPRLRSSAAPPGAPAPADRESEAADEDPRREAPRPPAETDPGVQAAFDRLDAAGERASPDRQAPVAALGRVEDLDLDLRFQRPYQAGSPDPARAEAKSAQRTRVQRKEQGLLPEAARVLPSATQAAGQAAGQEAGQAAGQVEGWAAGATAPVLRIGIFESELDPFRLSLLESGHFVLYRKVWRDGARSIQGALIDQRALLGGTVEAAFRDTVLSRMSDLALAYRGAVLAAFSAHSDRGYLARADELTGDLLHRARLSTPASDLELIFSIRRLPGGPGARVLAWTAATLMLVLCGGFLALERLGRREIDLARQRQDFVSAVSHELKTPLTSIRMYAEMLREGWADEGRRGTYYDFICAESERLTRLIENVLQLARLTRSEVRVDPKVATVAELIAGIRPKLASLTHRGGFRLVVDLGGCGATRIRVDEDFLTQILLNLVDNAVKFAKDAAQKEVRIGAAERRSGPRQLELSVRDFGPGVAKDQMKKIFELFYRSGNELTRETLGTGIGLALVRELTLAMGGRVDLVNARPGAEFRLIFPVAEG